jgi:hypothetical protein
MGATVASTEFKPCAAGHLEGGVCAFVRGATLPLLPLASIAAVCRVACGLSRTCWDTRSRSPLFSGKRTSTCELR